MAKSTGAQGGVGTLTRQRDAVLRVIRESEEHLTAGEIYEHARRVLPSISYATVYNSLRFLTEAGLGAMSRVCLALNLIALLRTVCAAGWWISTSGSLRS